MSTSRHRLALPAGHRLHWYTLDSVLGQGGFGITYLAHDTNLNQPVAIKEFLPAELASRDSDSQVHPLTDGHTDTFSWGLSRFVTEAQTLARFRHPNIVRVVSVFEANNTAYMVMEYERGESLEDAFRLGRIRDEAAMRALLDPLLDGLEHVHAAGFIHRDIKPDNIYLRADGTPVLLDFGSARQALGVGARTLTALVSPGYAPFEQYDNSRDADARQGPWTDVYALGATVYRGITGRGPPDAMARVNGAMAGGDVYRPLTGRTGVGFGAVFLAAVDRALGLRPEDRPASIEAWRCCLDGRPEPVAETLTPTTCADDDIDRDAATEIAARGPHPAPPPASVAPTRARPVAAVVALMLVIIAGVAGWFMRGGAPQQGAASFPAPAATQAESMAPTPSSDAGAEIATAAGGSPPQPPSPTEPATGTTAVAADTQATVAERVADTSNVIGAVAAGTQAPPAQPSSPTAGAATTRAALEQTTSSMQPPTVSSAAITGTPRVEPTAITAAAADARMPKEQTPAAATASVATRTLVVDAMALHETMPLPAATTPAPPASVVDTVPMQVKTLAAQAPDVRLLQAQMPMPASAANPAPQDERVAEAPTAGARAAQPQSSAPARPAPAPPARRSVAILPVYPQSLTWDSGGAAPDDVVDAMRAAVTARSDIDLRTDQAWGTTTDAVPSADALWGHSDPDEPPDDSTLLGIGEKLGVDLVVLWSLDPLDTTADWPVYIDVFVIESRRRYRIEGGSASAPETVNRLLDRALGR